MAPKRSLRSRSFAVPANGSGAPMLRLVGRHAVLDAAYAAPSVAPRSPSLFEGELGPIDLFAVVQLTETCGITGELAISSDPLEVSLFFDSGRLVAARTGEDSGSVAARLALATREGRFALRRLEEAPADEFGAANNTALLLGMLAEIDAAGHDDESVTHDVETPAEVAVAEYAPEPAEARAASGVRGKVTAAGIAGVVAFAALMPTGGEAPEPAYAAAPETTVPEASAPESTSLEPVEAAAPIPPRVVKEAPAVTPERSVAPRASVRRVDARSAKPAAKRRAPARPDEEDDRDDRSDAKPKKKRGWFDPRRWF